MPTNLFDGFELNEGQREFEKNILTDSKVLENQIAYTQKTQVIATLILAKGIEKSTKSNDKSSKRMFWLTVILAVCAILQVLQYIIPLKH